MSAVEHMSVQIRNTGVECLREEAAYRRLKEEGWVFESGYVVPGKGQGRPWYLVLLSRDVSVREGQETIEA